MNLSAWTKRVGLGLALTAIFAFPAAGGMEHDYPALLDRMTDLTQLAVLPEPGESCRQWSSWDRRSQYDAATGEYVDWSANGDGKGIIRQEGDTEVLAEMEGPGCIFRIWSALAEAGHVKIYLDGAKTAAVDLPFADYFSGDTPPFNYPALGYDLAGQQCRGLNLYLPIPYQKSCKIVAEPGWGRYYQFTYTTFPKGTSVPTFSAALVREHAKSLNKLNRFFTTRLGEHPNPNPNAKSTTQAVTAKPGERLIVQELDGPRAITALRASIDFSDREDQMIGLRELALEITFDGADAPQVWCPLGDFFGTAPGENIYRTLTTSMAEDGYYAYWYMPFAKSAVVALRNDGIANRGIAFTIEHAPLDRPFEGLGHFHAKWHRDVRELSADRWPDWTLLETGGRGRFCGVMLHVWNPLGGWWGEGDEKFFVDGEKFPSTFGTGSEDYFGYAWCHPGLFQQAFHAQTMTQQNKGHQSVLRWHVADNVPFQTGFEGTLEKYWRTEEKGTQYACVPIWYLEPGGQDPYGARPIDERLGYYLVPSVTAGGFKILNQPMGSVRTQAMAHYNMTWDKGDQLWWTDARPGDRLEVAFEVERAGVYAVSLALTKARDYGIVRFDIDGRRAGPPLSLYNPTVVAAPPFDLGSFRFQSGEHSLGIEIVGTSPEAEPGYMVGLDNIILEARGR